MRTSLCTFVATLMLSGTAFAGTLAPAKASSVVNLFAFPLTSAICCDSGTFAFDHQLTSDGTRAPFSVPQKETLVVTGFDWLSVGGPSGKAAIANLVVANNFGCDTLRRTNSEAVTTG